MRSRLVALAVVWAGLACGGGDASQGGGDAPEPSPTGTPNCLVDDECEEGVCWDLKEYDPACDGSVCSLECATDADCQEAAEAAEAPLPEEARCGLDVRCDFLNTGLAIFVCIRPSEVQEATLLPGPGGPHSAD